MKLEKCSLCGMCRSSCPVFRVMLTETSTPRAKSLIIKKELKDKMMYACTLCQACNINCPAGIKLDEEIESARKELVREGIETEANKKMMKNIREHGNPFGKVEKGKVPKDLYCC
jgi:Fe-S oxidoreductase